MKSVHAYGAKAPHVEPAQGFAHWAGACGDGAVGGDGGDGGGSGGGGGAAWAQQSLHPQLQGG